MRRLNLIRFSDSSGVGISRAERSAVESGNERLDSPVAREHVCTDQKAEEWNPEKCTVVLFFLGISVKLGIVCALYG